MSVRGGFFFFPHYMTVQAVMGGPVPGDKGQLFSVICPSV